MGRFPAPDWTYTVEDHFNDRSSTRTLSIVAFFRRLMISWNGPYRRHAGLDQPERYDDEGSIGIHARPSGMGH